MEEDIFAPDISCLHSYDMICLRRKQDIDTFDYRVIQ